MADSRDVVYFAVSNIPATFRSADLRNYFSQFVEDKSFVCFHYRHRPEVLRDTAESRAAKGPQDANDGCEPAGAEGRLAAAKGEKTCCCIMSVRGGEDDRFIRMYAGNHWVASGGDWLARRCVLRRIRVSDDPGGAASLFLTKIYN